MLAVDKMPVPDVSVSVNGSALPLPACQDLLEVRVEEHLDGPSAFSLRFAAWDKGRLDFSWADSDLFDIGAEVVIRMGYVGALIPLMHGDISALDLDIGGGEMPSLTVRGYDRRHRLQRRRRARTFLKMKDSDIAAQIAMDHGLLPQAVDSGTRHEHVIQDNISDLDFLTRRAASIGYEVVVVEKTLHFRPRRHGAPSLLVVDVDGGLLEFSAQLSTSDQVTEVEVRGWDVQNKRPIVGRATSGQETAMGASAGTDAARRAFGSTVLTIAAHHVTSQEEAERIAREALERAALTFIQGQGTCLGRTDLRVGNTVNVLGAGRRFSGAYYVTSTSHTYTAERGYRTAFTARRNAT